jgi:hypothetical protein
MRPEIININRYFNNTLGIEINPVEWIDTNRLPFFLRQNFKYFETQILGERILLVLDLGEQEQPPAAIRKYVEQICTIWKGNVLYGRMKITTYNRKRLIDQKIPFIVPGNQMYLPMLGIDLREHFRKVHVQPEKFSPATQTLILHCLIRNLIDQEIAVEPTTLRLGYSKMTITRSFNEIEATGIGECSQQGRERILRYSKSRTDIWKIALPFLRNPQKDRIYIQQLSDINRVGFHAGLSALSDFSFIAEPVVPVFAISRGDWKALNQLQHIDQAPAAEPGLVEIEIWSYSPGLLTDNKTVDRLSLYLSLKDSKDERIEAALSEMMEGFPW